MALLKKNIWFLFYVILSVGVISTTTFSYYLWNQIKNSYVIEQENLNQLASNSIKNIFNQYELILDLLGNELYENEIYQDRQKSYKVMQKILKSDKSIVMFALTKPDGKIFITSLNAKSKDFGNLMESEVTKESFKKALHSNSMIQGRTYYSKSLNKLIIPFRKALRDKNGNVVAVMSSAVNANNTAHFFGNHTDLKTGYNMLLLRASDFYYQLNPAGVKDYSYYEKQISSEFVNFIINLIKETYGFKDYNEIKNIAKPFTIIHEKYIVNEKIIATSQYIKKYDLWLSIQSSFSNITNQFYTYLLLIILVFIIAYSLLYFLFKKIDTFEKDKQKALIFQAEHDYLTGLHNRLYLSKNFENLKEYKPFSLLFIDMDNFKKINDQYGHNYGDIVLKEIAKRLNSIKNKKDTLIRYSGDEFILIRDSIEKDEVTILAKNIIESISKPFVVKPYQFHLSTSVGISQLPVDSKNFDETKRYADLAMYEAKKEKNTFCFFEDSIKSFYLQTIQIEEALSTAIENSEIYMVYQPQVDSQNKLLGVEALVRWENKKLGFVPPDKFIKIAEATGKMTKIGRFILETSLKEIKDIQQTTNSIFNTSINISVKQFMEVDFYSHLLESIEKYRIEKLNITLEITENIFIEDMEFILDLLLKIKEHNIHISLDDFGTGYSSLSLLKKLPIDELKIDKSFVDDILTDKNSRNMIYSIISIGKQLNMKVLAEGIETSEQKDLLDTYGCDLYQGYYFSKPLKKDDLQKYILDK